MTGCRSKAIVLLNDGFNAIRSQNFKRGPLCRVGERVRVLAHVQRPVRTLRAPIVADSLRDGQNVGFGKRSVQRRAAMSAGAEDDQLVRIVGVRMILVVLAFQPREIDQQLFRRGLACKR